MRVILCFLFYFLIFRATIFRSIIQTSIISLFKTIFLHHQQLNYVGIMGGGFFSSIEFSRIKDYNRKYLLTKQFFHK